MIRVCDNGHGPLRVQSGARCPACSRRREAGRPSRQARGYDADHARARAALAGDIAERAAGGTPTRCYYGCGAVLTAVSFTAAHLVDGDPSAGWAASCAPCNERAKRRGGGSTSERSPLVVPAPRQFGRRSGSNVPGGVP